MVNTMTEMQNTTITSDSTGTLASWNTPR